MSSPLGRSLAHSACPLKIISRSLKCNNLTSHSVTTHRPDGWRRESEWAYWWVVGRPDELRPYLTCQQCYAETFWLNWRRFFFGCWSRVLESIKLEQTHQRLCVLVAGRPDRFSGFAHLHKQRDEETRADIFDLIKLFLRPRTSQRPGTNLLFSPRNAVRRALTAICPKNGVCIFY